MSQNRLSEIPQRIARDLVDRLLGHVTWHASASRNLSLSPGDRYPLVIVLGREHYSERRKSYPALRRRDLEKVLREDLVGEPPTITLLGPIDGDRREVSFYRLDRSVIESLPRSLFIVPESVLLGVMLAAESWVDIERQNYRYFLFHDGPSQPAGGALGARELVAMAAGVDPDLAPEEWRGSDELIRRFKRALTALPALNWWSCRNPLPHAPWITGIAWKPVALTAGLMAFGYLVISSLYLQATLSYRESVLEAKGSEVLQGLVADDEARGYEAQRDALIELWSSRADTQQIWGGIASMLQHGATVGGIVIQGERISVRGEARDASEVLSELARLPQFGDVSFDAPVRSGRGRRQNFALSFALSGAQTATEKSDE